MLYKQLNDIIALVLGWFWLSNMHLFDSLLFGRLLVAFKVYDIWYTVFFVEGTWLNFYILFL